MPKKLHCWELLHCMIKIFGVAEFCTLVYQSAHHLAGTKALGTFLSGLAPAQLFGPLSGLSWGNRLAHVFWTSFPAYQFQIHLGMPDILITLKHCMGLYAFSLKATATLELTKKFPWISALITRDRLFMVLFCRGHIAKYFDFKRT